MKSIKAMRWLVCLLMIGLFLGGCATTDRSGSDNRTQQRFSGWQSK